VSSEVTLLDLSEHASDPSAAPGPRRFDSLTYDAWGALLAVVAHPPGRPCEAARIDAEGATMVKPACTEPRYDGWTSPDGALNAHLEFVGRGVMAPPSWRLFVQASDGERRAFVDHGGPYPGARLVTWSRTGHHLLVAAARLLFFDADTHRAWGHDVRGAVEAAAIDEAGGMALVALAGGDVAVVAREAHDEPRILGHVEGHVSAVAIEAGHAAVASEGGGLRVWDLAHGGEPVTLDVGGPVQTVEWSADGRVLAALSRGAVWLSPPAEREAVVLRPVRLVASTALVAVDPAGRVDAPADALALVRWRVAVGAGETLLLDRSAEERERRASPVASGLVAALFVSGP